MHRRKPGVQAHVFGTWVVGTFWMQAMLIFREVLYSELLQGNSISVGPGEMPRRNCFQRRPSRWRRQLIRHSGCVLHLNSTFV